MMAALETSMHKQTVVSMVAILLLAATSGLSCTQNSPVAAVSSAETQMDEQISFQLAIYYLPEPTKEPLAELDLALKTLNSPLRRVASIEDAGKSPVVAARMENDPQATYAPPGLDSLQYFGRGVTRAQAESLQQTKKACILDLSYPKRHVWTGMRSALEVAHLLATNTGGLVWDEATREVFSPEAWQERRITDWTEQVPDISKHTVIHAYKNEEYIRAITLGMQKFGLPDVVVDEFSWSLNRNMGHIVNLFSQALAEGATIPSSGDFDLDIRAIKNPKVRDSQIATLKSNATGIALLSLRKGVPEEGDPANRLVEIAFDRGVGPDIHAKQSQIVGKAFGFEDSITLVKHNEELEAASNRARALLPALRAEFNKGLGPGEFVQVKAPFFATNGESEWMWVEVVKWQGDKITGLLKNEPFKIRTLHAGQEVEVSEAKVFDYIRVHANGTQEGNETGKIIEQGRP